MHAFIHLRVHTMKFAIFDDASKCFAVEIYNDPLPVLWEDFKFPV